MTGLRNCIWCGKGTKGSLEHILPEALGCPPDFVLKEGVCRSCNNGLAHLDHALLHEYEILCWMSGIGRKRGRPPGIDSWAPIAAGRGPDGPEFYINFGPETITARGKALPAVNASHGITNAKFAKEGVMGTISFDHLFGGGPKFVRALYKVAFGSFAYFLGIETACDPLYDPIRAFVRKGEGRFSVLMLRKVDTRRNVFGAPFRSPETGRLVVGMTILGPTFIVDLDPDQQGIAHIQRTAPPSEGFIVLPLEPGARDMSAIRGP